MSARVSSRIARPATAFLWAAPSLAAALIVGGFVGAQTPVKTWIILAATASMAAACGYFRDEIRARATKLGVGLLFGAFIGAPIGATVARLEDGPLKGVIGGLSGAFKGMSAADVIALGVGGFMIMAGLVALGVAFAKTPPRGMPALSRSDRRVYAWVAPSYVAEGAALLALVAGRAFGVEIAGAVVALASILVAAGLTMRIWPKMDELTRNFSLEVFGWSFLIVFFAAPVWAALRLLDRVPAIGAYEIFIVMNAVYLAVTLALAPRRYGDGAFTDGKDGDA